MPSLIFSGVANQLKSNFSPIIQSEMEFSVLVSVLHSYTVQNGIGGGFPSRPTRNGIVATHEESTGDPILDGVQAASSNLKRPLLQHSHEG